jgi:hypothetical protein
MLKTPNKHQQKKGKTLSISFAVVFRSLFVMMQKKKYEREKRNKKKKNIIYI